MKPCFTIIREAYFFLQVCQLCESTYTIFCINHMNNPRSVCYISGHVSVDYERHSMVEMNTIVELLKRIEAGSRKLYTFWSILKKPHDSKIPYGCKKRTPFVIRSEKIVCNCNLILQLIFKHCPKRFQM